MKFKRGASPDEMPFLDHLEELRWRILWSLAAVLVGTLVGFYLVNRFDVLGVLIAPIRPFLGGTRLKYLSPADPFFITIRLAITVGLLLAFPVVLYQVWAFVSPALHGHEKRSILPALYLGLVLFLAGASLAYFGALPLTLRFMMGFQTGSLEQNIVIDSYLGFVLQLIIGFGAIFELPVVVLILSTLGIVSSRMLVAMRRYAIAITAVVASVLTPGDAVSLTVFLMAPLMLLYEMSIALARLVERRRRKREAAAAAREAAQGLPEGI